MAHVDSRVASVARGRHRYGLRHPVVLILLAAGTVDVASGGPIGGSLLVAVGIGLALSWAHPDVEQEPGDLEEEGLSEAERARAGGRSGLRALALAAALVGYAAIAALPDRFSWPATLLVALPGVVVVALARRPSVHSRCFPAVQPGGARPWVVMLVGIALWELVNLALQPSFTVGSYDHPTLSVLAEPILAGYPGRWAGVAVWLAGGWYLLERR